MSTPSQNFTYEVHFRDRSADSSVFTLEHEVFVAYLKKHLPQEEVHSRFEATFPQLAKPGAVGAFVGMYVARWAPVQDPDRNTVEHYTWGPEVLKEFEPA
ncbi:hypothetical protein MMC30_004610 [Trapelia coarctata]|nr:hypothetical protein [Trapelia coarctata]